MGKQVGALAAAGLLGTVAILGCGKDEGGTPAPTVNYARVDRMAIPTLSTVVIPANRKDAFNASSPDNDEVNGFRTIVEASITALRDAVRDSLPPENAGIPASILAGVVIPDIVKVDFTKAVAFPNGRRLEDDVVDIALGLVLNRDLIAGGQPEVPDDIDANDVPFLSTFPYLAAPH